MATQDHSSAGIFKENWDMEATNFFQYRIYEIKAALTIMISNLGEYRLVDDGRADDETIFLAFQQIAADLIELEDSSYRYSEPDLSRYLMWARALAKMLEMMIHSDEWKIRFSDDTLSGYVSLIERRLHQAEEEIQRIHDRHFKKAA